MSTMSSVTKGEDADIYDIMNNKSSSLEPCMMREGNIRDLSI